MGIGAVQGQPYFPLQGAEKHSVPNIQLLRNTAPDYTVTQRHLVTNMQAGKVIKKSYSSIRFTKNTLKHTTRSTDASGVANYRKTHLC